MRKDAPHPFQVPERAETDFMDRIERGYYRRIVGHRHRAGSPAVEAPPEGHHAVAPGVERSELEGVLVGLGPAVVQEEAVVGLSAESPETPCELLLQRIAYAVGIEAYAGSLLPEGFKVFRVAVAYGDDGVAAVEIEILGPFRIPHTAAPRTLGHDIEKRIDIKKFHIRKLWL